MAAQPVRVPELDDEQAIRALAKQFESHYNARDVEKLLALFTDDGRLLVPHREAAHGRAEMRALFQEGLDWFDPHDTVIAPTHIEFSGDVGFTIGYSTHNVRFLYGRRIDEHRKWITTLRREHGQWKLVALIYNTDLPMPRR